MWIRAIAALIAVAISAQVRAAFVNGVETFDGTTLDLTTWERYPISGTFVQNNSLTIAGTRAYSDYTTKTVTVGIGQRVTAEVTLTVPNEANTIYEAQLILTTNSQGTSNDTLYDSRFVGAGITFNSEQPPPTGGQYFTSFDGAGDGGYGLGQFGRGIPVSGNTYLLTVGRYSQDEFETGAALMDGTPIYTRRGRIAQPLPPDNMFISLHRTNLRFFDDCLATFDNVRITSVPEPAAFTLLLLVFASPRLRIR